MAMTSMIESAVGPVLLNIFNDVEGMMDCILFKYASYTTMSGTRQYNTCPVLSSSESKTDIRKLEQVQWRATKGVRSTCPMKRSCACWTSSVWREEGFRGT